MLFLFRIGGKPVSLAISFVVLIFFSACSNSSKNELTVFKALDESLINSNRSISKSTETILLQLQEKTTDPATAYRADIWYSKALMVNEESLNMISYIEELKSALKEEAGLNNINNSFNEEDKKAVLNLFMNRGKGKDLHEKLKNYKIDVLSIDPQINAAFVDVISITMQSFDSLAEKRKDFTSIFFEGMATGAALAVLSKFQNNIKVSENNLIQFCNNKVGSLIRSFDTYSAIVAQSSSFVRSGEEIEITAGIGAFSRASKPTITFDGIEVALDESGTATYKFNASTTAGKKIVPVRISYFDHEGKEQYIVKDVEYTVKD